MLKMLKFCDWVIKAESFENFKKDSKFDRLPGESLTNKFGFTSNYCIAFQTRAQITGKTYMEN